MQNFNENDSVLRGALAVLVSEGINSLLDLLSGRVDSSGEHNADNDSWFELGIELFDALSPSQQMAMLRQVTEELLVSGKTAESPSATRDATIAAVFEHLRCNIEVEIDSARLEGLCLEQQSEDDTCWRRLVASTYSECLALDGEIEGADPRIIDPEVAEFRRSWMPEASSDERVLDPTTSLANHSMDEHEDEMDQYNFLIESLTDRILDDRDFEMAALLMDLDPSTSGLAKTDLGIGADYFTEIAADPKPNQFNHLRDEIRQLIRRKPR